MGAKEKEKEGRERRNFKKLAQTTAKLDKSKNLQGRQAGWRPREELMFQLKSESDPKLLSDSTQKRLNPLS